MKYFPLYGILFSEGETMIRSLIKAANVLEALKESEHELTIAEISEIVDIPPSTAHRILSTLIEVGYAEKDDRTHLYSLGAGLIPLGIKASSYIDPQSISKDVLKNLSDKTSEDSFLIIKSGDKGLVISKAEGNHSLKIVENFGLEIDLHKGAIRKAILAFQSDDYIDYYLSKNLEDYLEGDVDKEKLKEDLREIRQNRFSISDSEYITEAIGMGAPVFNFKNELVGAVGIVVPKDRVDRYSESKYVQAVKNCGVEFSKSLGYSKY